MVRLNAVEVWTGRDGEERKHADQTREKLISGVLHTGMWPPHTHKHAYQCIAVTAPYKSRRRKTESNGNVMITASLKLAIDG